jgi:hypothetical protein
MPKEPSIVITEDDLGHEDEPIIAIRPEDLDEEPDVHIGPEDLAEGAAIVITAEDVAEGDMRALFKRSYMRQFIAFVSAGLPDAYVRAHPKRLKERREQIQKVIRRVPDQALRKHLASRLQALERLQAALDESA